MTGGLVGCGKASYARYEELLLRRDDLKRQAVNFEREYIRVFGEKILRNFELKVECIRRKKSISFCQMAANRGEIVDRDALQAYLARELAAYQEQLKQMMANNEAVKNGVEVSPEEMSKIKRLYRRLARRLHPDMNPQLAEVAELRDLWERIVVAYRCNNLAELEELSVLAEAALRSVSGGEMSDMPDIPDLEEKIAAVEAEIGEICRTNPYMYRVLLADEELVRERLKELDDEYASYEEYARQLEQQLQMFAVGEVLWTWRVN